jgi:helicase required for RNAi-mediated heterochromatin assembly 1
LDLTHTRFPLANHICSLDTDIGAPRYIKRDPVLDIQQAIEPEKQDMTNVLEEWPNTPMGSLDASQWAVLEQILTRKLAIVQGPPGTGKTFVSVAALKVLLANKLGNDPPIIVAAQTNHALDQLLTHVSRFENNFIRLGGRSSDPEIKKHTLYAAKSNESVGSIKGGLLGPSRKSFQGLCYVIAELLQAFNQESADKILPASFFVKHEVLTEGQRQSLEAGAKGWIQADTEDEVDPIAIWLGDQMTKFEVKYMTENFGFSEDEIDLEYEQLKELEAEQGIGDDDYESLKGQYSHIREFFCGQENGFVSKKAIGEYMRYHDLWKIPLKARGAVYNALRNDAKEKIRAGIRKLLVLYNLNCENMQIGKWERDYFTLQDANIIGMTTTGLSKYRGLVSSLKPQVILIEEAAEAIEAPISAACFDSLQHLILVGDHKQLKGTCAVQDLTGDPFFLDVSMFERLVHNGIKYVTLRRQRRMAPEIRKLLEPIYGKLQDHPAVLDRPNIPGMGSLKSYFFSHTWPENSDSLASKVNETEAEMITGFYSYLVMNGVPTTDITILTFYNGQRKKLLKLLKQSSYLQGQYVKVVTVDSYQGEENEVVILSLVRSGNPRNVGFLSVENRACVALSRAKRGFYIFGNAKSLAQADPLWWTVISRMGGEAPQERRLGFYLPLTCAKHGKMTFVHGSCRTIPAIAAR